MNASRSSMFTRYSGLALLLLIALGAFLRLHGIGFLLPEQTDPDGVVYSAQVKDFQEGRIDEETRNLYAFYPHLVSRLAVAIAPPLVQATQAASLEEHLERAAEPRRRIRITVALLSLLAIPAVWFLARRFLDPPFALAAAAFMATSFFTLWFAQQARPHAASSAFAALAVVAAVHLRAVGGWKAFACAGLAAGLAIGSLQSGTAVLPAIAMAVWLRARAREEKPSRIVLGSLAALAILALLVVVFYPFVFTPGVPGEIGKQGSMLRLSGHLVDLELFNGGGFATIARSAWEYDPVITALALLGAILGAHELWTRHRALSSRARDTVWVVLAFVVPYTIVIGLYGRTYQRFVLPLMPFECVMAGYALSRVVHLSNRLGSLARRLAVVGAVLALGFETFGAWRLTEARSRPSTLDEAARWIEHNVPIESTIAFLPMTGLPLMYSRTGLEASRGAQFDVSQPWYRYLCDLGEAAFTLPGWNIQAMNLTTQQLRDEARTDPDAFVRARNADYVVIPVPNDERRLVPWAIREASGRVGRRVARFSPDGTDEGESMSFAYQDDDALRTMSWFVRGLNARCVGPAVEIYALR